MFINGRFGSYMYCSIIFWVGFVNLSVILVCDVGKWGFECATPCKCNQANSLNYTECDPVDGQCDCRSVYDGIGCDGGRDAYLGQSKVKFVEDNL